jgi:putative ABC transport system permease protein
MEIGPILRALVYNKTRFGLVALEVALTLAVVVNCVHMMSGLYGEMSRPTGLDEDVLFEISISSYDKAFEDDPDYAAAQWQADLDLLRSLPGAVEVAKMGYIPLDGESRSRSLRPDGALDEGTSTLLYPVDKGIVAAYGVEIVAGRDFEDDDYLADQGQNEYDANVLVTQAAADHYFPDGDALGSRLGSSGEGGATFTIVGVIDELNNPIPGRDDPERALLLPTNLCKKRFCHLLLRSTPEAAAALPALIKEELLARNSGRRIFAESMTELRRSMFSFSYLLIQALVGVMGLLVFVTTLGIVGVTSFSVTQRTRQIGTRRALGARRQDILRYFLAENFLVTSVGLALGAVLSYVLSYGLGNLLSDSAGSTRLEWPLLAMGMVLLWLVGLGATLVPALRGTQVPPVVATRCV